MPDLSFEIASACASRDTIAPALSFELRITNRFPQEAIRAVMLKCQIQIEVARRRYTSTEQDQLRDLFDEPSHWGNTLRPMTWANTFVNVPGFTGVTAVPMVIPCTFDLNVGTAKYFHGISGGEVLLSFLFSGSVFFEGQAGALQIEPISWNKEARFRFSVQTWKDLMDEHYPNSMSLNLRRDVFDELYRFKMGAGLPTFDDAIQQMLAIAERERRPS
ncbi:MAG: DUF6084 family protein [Bryobacteraceae bacterium]